MATTGFIIDIVPSDEQHDLLAEEISARRRELRKLLLEGDHIEVSEVTSGDVPPGVRASFQELEGSLFVGVLGTALVTGTGSMIRKAARQLRKDAKDVKKASTDLRYASEDIKDTAAELQAVISNLFVAVRLVAEAISAQLRHFQVAHPELDPVVNVPDEAPVNVRTSSDEQVTSAVSLALLTAVADDKTLGS